MPGDENAKETARVSLYHTTDEKPQPHIQEDQVLFLYFYEEEKVSGRYDAA